MKKIYFILIVIIIIISSYICYKYYQDSQTKKNLQKLELYAQKRNELLGLVNKTVPFTVVGYKVKSRRYHNDQKKVKLGNLYVEHIISDNKRIEMHRNERERPKHGMGDVKEYEFLQAEYDVGTDNPENVYTHISYEYTRILTDDYKFYLDQQNTLFKDVADISEYDEDVKQIKYFLLTAIEQQIIKTEPSFNNNIDEKYEESLNTKLKMLISYKYDKLK